MKFLSPLIVTLLFSGLLIFGCESVVDKTDLVSDEIVQSVSDRHDGAFQACNCSYRILEVTPDDPTIEDYDFHIFSSGNICSGSCQKLFQGRTGCAPGTGCIADLNPIPSPLIPFECSINPFSGIYQANFDIFNCNPQVFLSGTIQIEIVCEGVEGKGRCTGSTTQFSDIHTYPVDAMWSPNGGLINFELGLPCGCQPNLF